MTILCGRAELRRVTSSILHYLDSKMRGMPLDCLVEVWTMAHPQVEGLERASRVCVSAQEGDGSPALDGEVLDLRTRTHRQDTSSDSFFWRLDYEEESLNLVFAEGPGGGAICVHTTEEFLYVLSRVDGYYRFPRSLGFIREGYGLSEEHRFSLRPWSGDDRRRNHISSATSCDNACIYATTTDLDRDAAMLIGRASLFWLDGEGSSNAHKWTRGSGSPGSKDSCPPFLQHHGVQFTTLTVSNQVAWLGVGPLEQERFWQVDLITETILAVFHVP
ncbi:hypothetical protein FOZ60_000335 [Perkinsus olseni]|uniref:Uncharacterized protein n=1 Tax=Perkinsus olseni TaxID=32597 RepID=A0A7J6N0M3_PEROL|nr:hypothetical protein FOZ60_000335 [Perkinsus olseni]